MKRPLAVAGGGWQQLGNQIVGSLVVIVWTVVLTGSVFMMLKNLHKIAPFLYEPEAITIALTLTLALTL